MSCLNDVELGVILWRTYAPEYDNRTLVRRADLEGICSLEKAINFGRKWRITDDAIHELFIEAVKDNDDMIFARDSLRDLCVSVGGERENGWLDELFQITIKCDEEEKAFDKDVISELHILSCVIAAAVDQNDVWSTTTLVQRLAPHILPHLRKRAASSNLNVVQTLMSILMETGISQEAGDFFGDSRSVLMQLDKVIDNVQEHLLMTPNPRRCVQNVIKTAAAFLLNCSEWRGSSKMKKAQQILSSHALILQELLVLIKKTVSNSYQRRSSFVTESHILLRCLLDRVICSHSLPRGSSSFTPAFKTPTVEADPSTPSSTKEPEDEPATPTTSHLCTASFLNNQTPTPMREPTLEPFESLVPQNNTSLLEVPETQTPSRRPLEEVNRDCGAVKTRKRKSLSPRIQKQSKVTKPRGRRSATAGTVVKKPCQKTLMHFFK